MHTHVHTHTRHYSICRRCRVWIQPQLKKGWISLSLSLSSLCLSSLLTHVLEMSMWYAFWGIGFKISGGKTKRQGGRWNSIIWPWMIPIYGQFYTRHVITLPGHTLPITPLNRSQGSSFPLLAPNSSIPPFFISFHFILFYSIFHLGIWGNLICFLLWTQTIEADRGSFLSLLSARGMPNSIYCSFVCK